jgi:beta-glucosidase-like glycosyl hydrolase
LDIEMPSANYLGVNRIKKALQSGNVTIADINDSVHRILRSLIAVGVVDESPKTWSASNLAREPLLL